MTDSFTNALLAFNQGRADALMWDDTVAGRRRRSRPVGEADQRHVPRAPVRDRDQAGERRAEAVGRLAARADAEEGPRSCRSSATTCRAAVRGRLLEEHPAAEQHVRVRAAGRTERGHRLLAAGGSTIATTGKRPRTQRPLPRRAVDPRDLRSLGVRLRELRGAPRGAGQHAQGLGDRDRGRLRDRRRARRRPRAPDPRRQPGDRGLRRDESATPRSSSRSS